MLNVLCPTIRKPDWAKRLIESFERTARSPYTVLDLILDSTDETMPEYYVSIDPTHGVALVEGGHGTMVERTNRVAEHRVETWRKAGVPTALGFCGHDNVFVTPGWDLAVEAAFEHGAGVVNTNDLLVGNEKGGVWFVRTDIVAALGWFLLPTQQHLYVDYAATELAKAAEALTYLPDVVIEHLHPYAGKAEWDDQYRSVNNQELDRIDRAAFENWYFGLEFQEDRRKVSECLAAS